MKTIFKFLKYLASFCIIWFFIHSIFITFDGLKDNGNNANVAVVLGNKVNEDGTLSNRLKARLDCSIHLIKYKRVKWRVWKRRIMGRN